MLPRVQIASYSNGMISFCNIFIIPLIVSSSSSAGVFPSESTVPNRASKRLAGMAGVAKCLRDEFEKVSGKFSEPSKLANAMRHGSLHEDEVVETIRSCLTVLRRYYRTCSPNFIELLMDLLAEKMPLTPKVAYRSPVRLRILHIASSSFIVSL